MITQDNYPDPIPEDIKYFPVKHRKKSIAFTIADDNNIKYAETMKKMFQHFNPKIELRIYGQAEIDKTGDKEIFYRATPFYAKQLMEEGYETVIKIDADTFIFGTLNHLWNNDKYDVGVVYNFNRIDPKTYGIVSVWDIPPQRYFNNGLVVLKNKKFVDWWWELCTKPYFFSYRMREQDLLNIMCHYGDYKVCILDDDNYWHGLISKGEGLKFEVKDGQIILPKGIDMFPPSDKIIKAYHVAGGHGKDKLNYRLLFQEPVIKFIDKILYES